LISTNPKAFYLLPAQILRRVVSSYSLVTKSYTAKNVCILVDAPFALFFAVVIYLISPELGLITIVFICILGIALILGVKGQLAGLEGIKSTHNRLNTLNEFIIDNFETIHYYDTRNVNSALVKKLDVKLTELNNKQFKNQDHVQCLIRSATAILTVLIVAVGAVLVVKGLLNIGEMIGINILAVRSLLPVIAVTQQAMVWAELRDANKIIKEFNVVGEDNTDGIAIKNLEAIIELKSVSFSYGPRHSLVLDQLDLKIHPGNPLCIHGSNGTGKTTLVRILTGQLSPQNGKILVDGINLEQISKTWWQEQIVYVPQFPQFFEGTIRQNFLAYNKELIADDIRKLVLTVGLDNEIDSTPLGIDTNINEVPKMSSLGYRKRLAYARALAHNGQIVIIDDPTIGMDQEGISIILELITRLAESAKTVIIISNDEKIFRGCSSFLNFDDGSNAEIKNVNNS